MTHALLRFVRTHPRLFVLTGAGLSTASGIPAYRDEFGGWQRKPPVNLSDFVRLPSARRRLWARSMIGWPMIMAATPNPGHSALARLQTAGFVQQIVTQNVDGLHRRAGSDRVIELHGNLEEIICLDCGTRSPRAQMQHRLEEINENFRRKGAAQEPDGDAAVGSFGLEAFEVPACLRCGGILKPDVVFFGEAVPRERMAQAMEALKQAQAILVVGSSLMVHSGFRFCQTAAQWGMPIAAINLGRTRADALFDLKIERPCAEALQELLCEFVLEAAAARAA